MRAFRCAKLQAFSALDSRLLALSEAGCGQKQAWGGFAAQARVWFSGRVRVRARSHSERGARAKNYHEEEQMQRIERENELWRIRCTKGEFSLPPALHVVCRKGKGQHLLKNSHIVECIVDKADIRNTDTVLEIGPGTGNLTLRLLEVAKKVIAVEVDPRMVEELQRRAQQTDFAHKLEVVRADIMRMELPEFDICVANIPYKISSPLTFKLLRCRSKFRAAVLMLQREFARRLMATAGNPLFCRLSVNTQLLASVNVLMEVSKANFSPPPKVDSSVVCIRPRCWPPPVDLEEWDNFIRVCFSRKNKTLGAIFRQKHVISLLAGQKSQGFSDFDESSMEDTSDVIGIDLSKDLASGSSNLEDELGLGNDNAMKSDEDLLQLKEKAICTLSAGGFENKRSVKLTLHDLLKLLASFNEAGIKFA